MVQKCWSTKNMGRKKCKFKTILNQKIYGPKIFGSKKIKVQKKFVSKITKDPKE